MFLAVWLANLVFAAAGVFLLWQMASGGRVLSAIVGWASRTPRLNPAAPFGENGVILSRLLDRLQPRVVRTTSNSVFPRILDELRKQKEAEINLVQESVTTDIGVGD